ncbi:MAG: SH3 domain-containing protein, partial [Chloroflexota bacterium]|nr:SH3 domain-containing protein [Chloroflexota bacterium]
IPPTATATDLPPTATSIPPTATATDPPPTATDTATATETDAPPTATATATEPPPTATSVESAAPRYIVDTAGNRNANIRACPRRTCDILTKFAPGTEVDVLGPVSGEIVYGTDVWYEIKLEDGSAFIHSELAEERE